MQKLNPKSSSNYLLKLLLETNKDLVSKHCKPLISLAMAESLDRELHGVPQSSHTSSTSSHSSYSDSYSWYEWRKYEYPKYWNKIKNFVHYRKYSYKDKSFNRRRCYYKFITIKPLKNSLTLTEKISHKIIHRLRKNRSMALILRSIENTWTYSGDNYHVHFLIVSTKKLSKRKLSTLISKTINSKHTANVEDIWYLKHLVRYMTKQCGYFPLMSKGNDKTKKPQIQILRSFPLSKQKAMIARDVRTNKGLQRHKLYYNSKNEVVKSIKAHRTSKPKTVREQRDATTVYQYLEVHDDLLKYYQKHPTPMWLMIAKIKSDLALKIARVVNPRTSESSSQLFSKLSKLSLSELWIESENIISKSKRKHVRKYRQLKDKLTYKLLSEQHGKLWQSTIIWARNPSTTADDIERRLNTPKGKSVPLFTAKTAPTVKTANGRTFTRHHTSNNEAIRRFYGGGYYSYATDRDVAQTKSISLFVTVSTRRPRNSKCIGTTSQNLIEPKVNLSNSNKNSNSKFENENPRSRTSKDSS